MDFEKIRDIESEFERISSNEPKILSASTFHTGMYSLLVDCLKFRYSGEMNLIYQNPGSVFEDDSFAKGRPVGFVYGVDKKDFERFIKDLRGKNKPQNYSRKLYYIRNEGEGITISSHHESPLDLIEGKLRSQRLNESTTIVYKSNNDQLRLGRINFEKAILENLGKTVSKKENTVADALDRGCIVKYKERRILPVSFVVKAAKDSIKSQIHPPSISA